MLADAAWAAWTMMHPGYDTTAAPHRREADSARHHTGRPGYG